MTILEVSRLIRHRLKDLYPLQEIDAFTEIIFNHLLNYKRLDIHLNASFPVSAEHETQIYDIILQLERYRPIQYVVGYTEFYGRKFLVDENVLIPRPETEELVEWILHDFKNSAPVILDIGTGSGCIAISLASELAGAPVYAADISMEALDLASQNGLLNKTHVNFFSMDILGNRFPEFRPFDVIVSNPPYVTIKQKDRMEPNVLNFEPALALFVPDEDPLLFYKAIGIFAHSFLNPEGFLYFEINEDLSGETSDALQSLGFNTELKKDIHGKYRMLKASKR